MRGPGIAALSLPLLFGACAHSDPGGIDDGGTVDAPAGDGDTPDAPPDAATDAGIDGAPVPQTWRDDTAADFAPGTLERAALEGYGALTPAAYYTGGLLWRAADADTFDSGAAATWAGVSALPATGKLALARATALFFAADTPPSVGLTDPDTFSMWFEGEVLLDAGTYTFEMLVDDHGFVEVAPSSSAAFQRIASCDWPTAATGNFTAPAAGWSATASTTRSGAISRSASSRPTAPLR